MNFTFEIKKEIISHKMNKEEARAFISGVITSNIINKNQEVKIKLLNQELMELLLEIIKKTDWDYQIQNKIILMKDEIVGINPENANIFFAGIFLSSGSISNLDSSSYHLEINFKNENECDLIQEFAKKHISFNKIKNKNYFVLYLKKNEMIADFLQIIGAQKSYFSFIDSIIERDFKNQITRIFNLDVHNQNRLVDSNIQFNEYYNYIIKNKLTSKFNQSQLEFYEFKKNNQFLSLSQISEELFKRKKIKKTKSCLNHWLIKLRNVCEEHENQNNKK